MKRMLKHLSVPRWRVRQAFPKVAMKAIEAAVEAPETLHNGELRFVVEGGLDLRQLLSGVSARQRAEEMFSRLRVWDTEHNSGVLIYVQLADRQVEILADRGIHKRVGDETWQRICAGMERAFRVGKFLEGAIESVEAVGRVLAEHFPAQGENPDELANSPVLL
jgi:uncharacterized membrane protein